MPANVPGFNEAAEQFSETPTSTETTVEFTTTELVEEQIHTGDSQLHLEMDPYEDKTPKKLLKRKYLIMNKAVKTLARNIIYPLKELLLVPCIAHTLKGFEFLRSDITLELLLTTNGHVYGTTLVSSIPHQDPEAATPKYGTITQQIQGDAHLLDLNMQQSITMKLPFLYPNRFMSITELAKSRQWQVNVTPICMDTLTAATLTEFNLEIWASFDEPQLSGYLAGVFQSGRVRTYRDALVMASDVLPRAGGMVASAANLAIGRFGNAISSPIMAAAATGAATATTGLGAASQASNIYRAMRQSNENSSVKPQMCPDLNGDGVTILPLMGDSLRGPRYDVPTVRNEGNIADICGTPAYVGTTKIDAVDDLVTIGFNPAVSHSYLAFFSRIFKYVRYDTKLFIRISTAQDVSAKLSFVLKPRGGNSGDLGDLPNWDIAVRGTTDFSIVVPYMEKTHWIQSDSSNTGSLTISLINNLPQLFDKPVSLYVSVFVAPVNLRFASLQSPCNVAHAQSDFTEQFGAPHVFGTTYESTFMGGYTDIMQILQRYSSRDVNPNNFFPFPREINADLWEFDTFDYLAQLYAFFSGSMDVKYGLTKGPTTHLLKMVTGNSHDDSEHGTSSKAGNSMILTSQSVWPVVEFNYPYERLNEYESLAVPTPHFIPEFSDITTVSEILLRPGPDFSFYTRLPTPDWASDFAVFQSHVTRLNGHKAVFVDVDVHPGSMEDVLLPGFPNGEACQLSFDLQITRKSGNTDNLVAVCVASNDATPNTIASMISVGLISAAGVWTDSANSGKAELRLTASGAVSGYSSTWRLRAATEDPGSVFRIVGVVTARPYQYTTMPLTAGFTEAGVALIESDQATPVLITNPSLDVNISQTLDAHVTNPQLAVVCVNETPIEVYVGSIVDIQGSVTVPDGVSITGPVPVFGAPQPERPVWTTVYQA